MATSLSTNCPLGLEKPWRSTIADIVQAEGFVGSSPNTTDAILSETRVYIVCGAQTCSDTLDDVTAQRGVIHHTIIYNQAAGRGFGGEIRMRFNFHTDIHQASLQKLVLLRAIVNDKGRVIRKLSFG